LGPDGWEKRKEKWWRNCAEREVKEREERGVIEGLGKRGLVGRVVVVLKPRATRSREQTERGWETVKAA